MKHVICIAVILLSSLSLAASRADENDKDVKGDLKLMQGTWIVVALEKDGNKARPEALKKMRWIIKGSEVEAIDLGDVPNSSGKGSFKLDWSKTPRQIDMVSLDGPTKGKTVQGIYRFEKDQLVICIGEKERPTNFETKANSGQGTLTLERLKDDK